MLHESRHSVKILLARGANPTIVGDWGETLLHVASQFKTLETLSFLLAANLNGIDVNAIDKAGKTAMELALAHEPKPEGFIEVFRALIFGIGNRNDYAKRKQNVVSDAAATAGDLEAGENIKLGGMIVPGAWPDST